MNSLTRLNVVRCRGLPIMQQLRAEEVLLRRTKENWFITNCDMRELSIVLGFGGKMHELVDIDLVKQSVQKGKQINIIRRYTGGGTVIVDHNTLFASFIMNTSDAATQPFPRDIMSWSEAIYKPVFNSTGGDLGEDSTDADALTTPHFALRENDYILGDLKVGGNAQSITKGRWVHHTSFLWDYSEANMQYLLMPKKRPEYRRDRPHGQFLDRISRHIKDQDTFERRVSEQLADAYDIDEVSQNDMLHLVDGLTESADYTKPPDVRTRLEDALIHRGFQARA